MKNKLFLATILFASFSLQLFSQTTTYKSKSKEGLTLLADFTIVDGLVVRIQNEKNNSIDTVAEFIYDDYPYKFKDVWFNSSACGFILDAKSFLQYFLYVKDINGWKIVAEEIIMVKYEPQKVGFGGIKLLDAYTLLISESPTDKRTKRIHLYDDKGNRRILNQVKYEETKYKY
jgi:hypothetical protein